MKCSLIIIIILFTGAISPLRAQQLASEKPVESFYSKTTKRKLQESHTRQPATHKAWQELPDQKTLPQASVPAQIRPAKQAVKRSKGTQKLASEKPVDMEKINRRRSRTSQ